MAGRTSTGTGSGSAAYQRMAAREEEARAAMNDRLEKQLDRIIDEIGEVKIEVRRIDQKSGGLENRMSDIERQMIDTRDAVQRARAATPALTVSAGRQVVDEAKKSWLVKTAAAAIAVMAIWTLYRAIPEMVRGADHLVAYFRTADEPYKAPATKPA